MKYTLFTLLVLSSLLIAGCSSSAPTPADTPTPANTANDADMDGDNNDNEDSDEDESDDAEDTDSDNDDATANTAPAGTARLYTMADVQAHDTESSCRTVIRGQVYDVTAFIDKHPGGDRNILRTCGIDATDAFERKHGGQENPENALKGFEIGVLQS